MTGCANVNWDPTRSTGGTSQDATQVGHDDEMVQHGDADWAGYYAWSAGREPRPLLLAACEELGSGEGRMAIDLGCGEGTEALELLARGWSVTAVDTEEAGLALLHTRIPASAVDRIRIVCASFTEVNLPRAYLIHAGFSLPFCPSQSFPAMWVQIRQALVPSGIFAGQMFGNRDSWAGDPSMTFHTRHEVDGLLDGLQILRLCETERDGQAFSGPKHWHLRHPCAEARQQTFADTQPLSGSLVAARSLCPSRQMRMFRFAPAES
jgi:SAM-dependent methyltransferase